MLRAATLVLAALIVSCSAPDARNDDDDDGDAGEGEGEGEGAGDVASGAACACDTDCAGTPANPGVCAFGICMQRAAAACSGDGSTAECGEGSRCWPLEAGDDGTCWPDCDAFACDGACDADGSCAPTQATVDACDGACSAVCTDDGEDQACTEGSCDAGFTCGAAGRCMLDVGQPPTGPVPACGAMPELECNGTEAFCGELVSFDPRDGEGYADYPLNGETAGDQYRSFVRRDLRQMITYAAAATSCLGVGFAGNGGDIMLGDMSEANGDIPGTSDGSPGHPPASHERGYDMDIGYYQVDTADNRLREVCDHVVGGEDQYHCLSEPFAMDIWRTALFLGKLQDNSQFRAAGVDGKAGPLLIEAAEQLCDRGFLEGNVCNEGLAVVFDVSEAQDIGWFFFHHHHFHVTILDKNGEGLPNW